MGGFFTTFFASAPLLLGALGAAVPFILHMVFRRRAPKVRFSTLRFIRASAERTARRRRIRDWLLLFLRSGAIFFLAVGLAGPILRTARLGRGGDLAVALVLDNSYSMAVEVEQVSAYARARDAAVRILTELPAEAQAAVFYAWPASDASLAEGQLTTDRNGLADAISRSEVSVVPGDLAATVTRAEKLLADSPANQRELYVFTDRQKASWRPLAPASDPRAPALFLVDCASGERENVAVTALRMPDVRPAVGVPLTVHARVRNYGRIAKSGKALLYVERRLAAERTVSVAPNAEVEVAFPVTFVSAGVHSGWVDVEAGDVLPLDNRRYFALEVPQRLRVGLVREAPGALPVTDEAFFLAPALNPAGAGAASAIAPELLVRADLALKPLRDYRVLFLLDLPELDPAEARALAEYVQAGGAVVLFPGETTRTEAWNALLKSSAAEAALLPARFGRVLPADNAAADAVRVESGDSDHPIFQPFKGLPPAFLNSVVMKRYFELLPVEDGAVRVLARLSDGRPFLLERKSGDGTVLMFSTSATARGSNLPTRQVFLPLLHQVTYHLSKRPGTSSDVVPGQSVRFAGATRSGGEIQANTTIEVAAPRGEVHAAAVDAGPGGRRAVYTATDRPGVYTWRNPNVEEEHGAFAVNLVTLESDLETWPEEAFAKEILSGRRSYVVRDGSEAVSAAQRLRHGVQMRTPLLFFVIGLLIAECVLANHLTLQKRRDADLAVSGAMGGAR